MIVVKRLTTIYTSSIVIDGYSNFGNTYLSKEFARVLGQGFELQNNIFKKPFNSENIKAMIVYLHTMYLISKFILN
jgi:hypothetical protein